MLYKKVFLTREKTNKKQKCLNARNCVSRHSTVYAIQYRFSEKNHVTTVMVHEIFQRNVASSLFGFCGQLQATKKNALHSKNGNPTPGLPRKIGCFAAVVPAAKHCLCYAK